MSGVASTGVRPSPLTAVARSLSLAMSWRVAPKSEPRHRSSPLAPKSAGTPEGDDDDTPKGP